MGSGVRAPQGISSFCNSHHTPQGDLDQSGKPWPRMWQTPELGLQAAGAASGGGMEPLTKLGSLGGGFGSCSSCCWGPSSWKWEDRGWGSSPRAPALLALPHHGKPFQNPFLGNQPLPEVSLYAHPAHGRQRKKCVASQFGTGAPGSRPSSWPPPPLPSLHR